MRQLHVGLYHLHCQIVSSTLNDLSSLRLIETPDWPSKADNITYEKVITKECSLRAFIGGPGTVADAVSTVPPPIVRDANLRHVIIRNDAFRNSQSFFHKRCNISMVAIIPDRLVRFKKKVAKQRRIVLRL